MQVNAYWTTGCVLRIFLSVWGQTMADIVISCPVFGKAVPTGITTDHIILGSLNFVFTMQCPCLQAKRFTELATVVAIRRALSLLSGSAANRRAAVRHRIVTDAVFTVLRTAALASIARRLSLADRPRKAPPAEAATVCQPSIASLRSSNQVSKPVHEDFELVRVAQEIYSDSNGS